MMTLCPDVTAIMDIPVPTADLPAPAGHNRVTRLTKTRCPDTAVPQFGAVINRASSEALFFCLEGPGSAALSGSSSRTGCLEVLA